MNNELKTKLRQLATLYETESFVVSDPVKFPHRFMGKTYKKQDVEVAGFIAAWMSYGNRKAFCNKIDVLLREMFRLVGSPYKFIMRNGVTLMRELHDDKENLYRFYSYGDFYDLCENLFLLYQKYETMEVAVQECDYPAEYPVERLVHVFYESSTRIKGVNGIPSNCESACKRLNMFLRWMVRKNSPVDLGVWTSIHPNKLLIPLDVHVARVSRQLGLVRRRSNDFRTILQLTHELSQAFPNDPCRGDFALFGWGVEHGKEDLNSKEY